MTPTSRILRRSVLTGAVVLTSFTSSCVIVSDSGTDVTGNFVSSSTLKQIERGASKDYVESVLGAPTTQTPIDDATEIWRWTYSESRTSSAKVFLLLSDSNRSNVEKSTFVEFLNGEVSKAWRD